MRHTRIRIWLRRCCKIDGIRDGIRRDPTSVEFRKISKTRGRGVKKSLGIRDGSDGIRVLFLSKSREMIRRCGENGAGSETSFQISAIRFCLDVLSPCISSQASFKPKTLACCHGGMHPSLRALFHNCASSRWSWSNSSAITIASWK